MSVDQILTSIHGKRFGLSASGGLLAHETSATGVKRAVMMSTADVIQGKPAYDVQTASASGAVITNYGLTHVTSGVVNGATLTVSAPAAGVEKEIFFDSSASTLSLGTTAAGITFGASVGSSVLNMDAAGGVRGTGLIMRGLSSTRWALLGRRKLGD